MNDYLTKASVFKPNAMEDDRIPHTHGLDGTVLFGAFFEGGGGGIAFDKTLERLQKKTPRCQNQAVKALILVKKKEKHQTFFKGI